MKEYKVGYIAGVFDLFHVGHLALLRKAKEKCEYLIVGALEDDLVVHFKNKAPIIPLDERMEILSAIRYVDQVVSVNEKSIDKMTAWNLYHFDCLFSGDDYKEAESWKIDKQLLNKVGSDIYFFPYTQKTSSTKIKESIEKNNQE